MRDGFHPEYHDDRFFEDDGPLDDEGFDQPPRKPEPVGIGRRLLALAGGALRLLSSLVVWFVSWLPVQVAAIVAVVAMIVFVCVGAFSSGPVTDRWPTHLLPTQEIAVPAPAGWPDLPVTVLRTDPPFAAGAPLAWRLVEAEPAAVPAPAGWPGLPLDGRATLAPPSRGFPLPVFENFADQPTAGAKALSYEVVAAPRRPLDALGRWLGAPTASIRADAREWGEARTLPLAFFTVDPEGLVVDAMPGTMEWFWLAWAALLAWGAGTVTAWIASHEDCPFGLPYASFESDTGRRYGSLVAMVVAAAHFEHTGAGLQALVMAAALLSFGAGRAARARWQALALGLAAAWLGATTPILDPIPALAGEYGALGIRAWDMLTLGAVAAIALILAIPRRDRSTHVTVQERPHPLVQDVRVVGQR